jgi:cysteinyl-tRNA synthetase
VLVSKKTRPAPEHCAGYIKVIKEAGRVLGVLQRDPNEILDEIKEIQVVRYGVSKDEVEDLLVQRSDARKEKNFKKADEIRDTLLEKNILIQDTPEGTKWSFN